MSIIQKNETVILKFDFYSFCMNAFSGVLFCVPDRMDTFGAVCLFRCNSCSTDFRTLSLDSDQHVLLL